MLDEDSPILDFYPESFEIDMNGKKMFWQGVALLPFIDRSRLLAALEPLLPKLSAAEQQRNSLGHSLLFVGEDNPQYDKLSRKLYSKKNVTDVRALFTSWSFP
jgi:5'-3' exoribonuclease 2